MKKNIEQNKNVVSVTAKSIALLFDYPFDTSFYLKAIKDISGITDSQIVSSCFNQLIQNNTLITIDSRVRFNPEYRADEFKLLYKLKQSTRQYILSKISDKLMSYFNNFEYSGIIKNLIKYQIMILSTEEDTNILVQEIVAQLQIILRKGVSDKFQIVVDLFQKNIFTDTLKEKIISVLYDACRNNNVTSVYRSLSNENVLSIETQFKVCDAFFMLGDSEKSEALLNLIKDKTKNDAKLLERLNIVELMHQYELSDSEDQKEKCKDKYKEILSLASGNSYNTFLLIRFSSSLLKSIDSINLMKGSKDIFNTYPIYNNLGALYLSQGNRDRNPAFISKAEKYLQFASFICEENEIYSSYVELNNLTLDCYKLFHSKRKKKKMYSKKIEAYKRIKSRSDSQYFANICNCYIYAIAVLTKNFSISQEYFETIVKSKNESKDMVISRKINDFLNFGNEYSKKISDARLPVWIITETHY